MTSRLRVGAPPPRPRTGTVIVAACLAAILIGWIWATPVAAHAQLVETSPTGDELLEGSAPDQISLRFDEPMQITDDSIRVFDPDGDRVDDGTTRLSGGDLELTTDVRGDQRGSYTVAWRATSQDGHTLSGSFVFHVDVRTGAPAVDDGNSTLVGWSAAVARWLGFAGMVTAIGAVLFAMLAGDPASATLRRLCVVGASVGWVGGLLLLVAETASSAGRGLLEALPLVADTGVGSRTGRLIAWRTALLALVAASASLPLVWLRARVVPILLLVGAAVLSSVGGHPWTASARTVAVVADSVHLIAAGAWVGGVLALLVVVRTVPDPAALVRRFSAMALGLVAVVAISGTVSGLFQVPDVAALTTTTYGRLLTAKLVLFAAIVALGWINRSRVLPAIEGGLDRLVRNLRLEVAVAAVLLAFTAALVEQPPARVSVDQPVDQMVRVEDATMQINVTPARVGENDIHLYFFAPDGSSPLAIDAVEVTASTGDVPPRRLDVVPVTASHVSVLAATLGAPGTWTLAVTAIREGEPMELVAEVPIR